MPEGQNTTLHKAIIILLRMSYALGPEMHFILGGIGIVGWIES